MSAPGTTPGPWWPLREGSKSYVMYHDAKYGRDFPVTSVGLDELNGNLALMAAAPDLYEALSALLEASEQMGYVHYGPMQRSARAVLAKAKGEA